MIKFLKIALVILFFAALLFDVIDFFQFQPDQILPPKTASSINVNQIFAYKSIQFKGNFLLCNGSPILEYQDKRTLEIETQEEEGIKIIYPVKDLLPGEVVKSGYKVKCNVGLIFAGDGLSFHLFDNTYYAQNYNIDTRKWTEEEVETQFKALSSLFKIPDYRR